MLIHGIHSDQLSPEESLSAEELEVFGVDWAALRNEQIIASVQHSVPAQGEGDGSSWIGQVGPPAHLNEVAVNPPSVDIGGTQLQLFEETVARWSTQAGGNISIPTLWMYSVALARLIYGNVF